MNCLNCNLELKDTPKKRPKIFCNSSCRSNYWQRIHRMQSKGMYAEDILKSMTFAKKRGAESDSAKKVKLDKEIVIKDIPRKEESLKNELWKEGDPKENSIAFFKKYDCMNYLELKNKAETP